MKNQTHKKNTFNSSNLLTHSEIDSLLQGMREAEAGMTEIIRNDPNFSKIKELLIEIQKYPKDSFKRLKISREITRLQMLE